MLHKKYISPLWIVLVILASTHHTSCASKILMYPLTSGGFSSHLIDMTKLGRMLIQRGDDVTMLISTGVEDLLIQEDFNLLKYKAPTNALLFTDEEYREFQLGRSSDSLLTIVNFMVAVQTVHCEALLKDKDLLMLLKTGGYQAIIVDYGENCARIIVDYLDIPSIVYSGVGMSIDAVFFPSTLSFLPMPSTKYTDHMNFADRFSNVLIYVLAKIFVDPTWYGNFNKLKQEYNLNVSTPVQNSYLKSVVMSHSDFSLDFPRPLMPNIIHIGGIFYEPPSSLPDKLEKFIQGSGTYGVIVICFGTLLSTLDERRADIFARVFSARKERVVWRYTGSKPSNLGKNILLLDWLPQNDLLGHTKVKAFVSHCGMSSTYEAIHNTIPVVAVPVAGDQFQNAARLVHTGMAELVDFQNLEENDLAYAINKIITDSTYKDNALKTSKLLFDQPIPVKEKFVYYVDYVIRHNGIRHMEQNAVRELNIFQLYCIDVFACLISVLVMFVVTLYCVAKCCCKLGKSLFCFPKSGKRKLHRE